MSIKNLSVFFPVFNEEGNIENTIENALKVLEKLKLEDYEVIVVDDGSTDKTGKVADSLAKQNPKVRVIHHPKNSGYGEALKSGFYNAKFDTIVYTDGDGQFDFSEVNKFLEKIETNDLIIGYRIKRRDPFFRIFFKKGWKLTLLAFFRLTLKDVDCGFKMVKRKVLEKIPRLESSRGAMINAELAIKAKKAGFKIGQVGVNHFPRLSGKPTGANFNVIIKSYLDLIKLWWELKDNKTLFLCLLGIILLACFLRFYKLSGYMTFLGDEGRDAIIIKKILTEGDLPFIGPPTSVGNIYLGPFYYYMMTIPMAIFWLNPTAAAGMDALIGVATVMLIYYLGKIWFGRASALIAAFLYAISPVNIIYSRSSWNPNPAPFFSLIGIWGCYKAYQTKNFLWFILVGAAAAAALQMHYLVVLLIPIYLILWFFQYFQKKGRNILTGSLGAVIAFWAVMLPFVLFDLRNNFLNFRAIKKLLFDHQAVEFNPLGILVKVPGLYFNNLIGRYITAENLILTAVVGILILLPIIKLIVQRFKGKEMEWSLFALAVWLVIGLVGLSLYQSSIYDHYLGFLNPAPYLLLAASLNLVRVPTSHVGIRLLFWTAVPVLLLALTLVNLQKNPLVYPPNNQLKRTQDVAKFIIDKSEGRSFNFALLAKNNYDSTYQFYLDLYGHKPKPVPAEKTDQLFVVCEDPVCDPTHSPKHEIAAFGWSKIEWEQEVYGVKLYKLIANPSGRP
ncbi:MAG: Glycosyltransferase [Microgenomates group bacterium Gr01-1014_7]|nr:MAG: Glycosyltransferase [Microgenomates group bacterium Gr01-1014_7]